jgi:hypothetical protein
VSVRRTRAGDAWERAALGAGAGDGGSDRPGTFLGLPSLGAPALR